MYGEDKLARIEAPTCGRQELLLHAVSRRAEGHCSNTCFFSWMTLPWSSRCSVPCFTHPKQHSGVHAQLLLSAPHVVTLTGLCQLHTMYGMGTDVPQEICPELAVSWPVQPTL